VVVQAAGEDPGRVRDLAYGGGPVTLLREELAGQHDHVGAALGPDGSVGGRRTCGSAPAASLALPRRAHVIIIAGPGEPP
jgi:hypothetical protein